MDRRGRFCAQSPSHHRCVRLRRTSRTGDLEILTLAGTISEDGSHLHMSVANAEGWVFGGHIAYGCAVRTTAEVLLLLLPEWSFTRELDPRTGFAELVIRPGILMALGRGQP
jgi:predicted DNA-binding protein with PD1-like motif